MTPFVGEIALVGFNFAPVGWAFCDGSLLSISVYPALFNLIGTTYGGNGVTNFALPDLRSRIPVHQTSGYVMGAVGGTEEVTITLQTMPQHSHLLTGAASSATSRTPTGNVLAMPDRNVYTLTDEGPTFNSEALATAGGSQPHLNLQPYLAISYIIALDGIYPTPG